jgi:hypothetical protein
MQHIMRFNTGNGYNNNPESEWFGQVIDVYDTGENYYFQDHSRGIRGNIEYSSDSFRYATPYRENDGTGWNIELKNYIYSNYSAGKYS